MDKRVAFLGKNTKSKYSGGRIHALMLAISMANLGFTVDFYTNYIPLFYKDLEPLLKRKKINFKLNRFFSFKARESYYQNVFLIPHLNSKKNYLMDKVFFYRFAKKLKLKNKAKMYFLDFESPNWVMDTAINFRTFFSYKNSDSIIKFVDVIISSTNIGSDFAQKYYKRLNEKVDFKVLYPPINSSIADQINYTKRTRDVVFFARFDGKHKAPEVLFKVIKSLPKNYNLNLITNKSLIPQDMLDKIENLSKNHEMSVKFLDKISDIKKFEVLGNARLLIFSSNFEGFGLPPVEAQYMNTPVICSNLPVLMEVNKKALFTDFSSEADLKLLIEQYLEFPPEGIKESVIHFAKFENFTKNLKKML